MQRVESSNGLSHAYQVNRIFCLSNFSLDRCLLRRPEVCLLPERWEVGRNPARYASSGGCFPTAAQALPVAMNCLACLFA
jgi:hypothetical protein